ncbi:MAG: hypothetical protein ACRDZ1_12250, partial [Acidimicrobiia bacterium]
MRTRAGGLTVGVSVVALAVLTGAGPVPAGGGKDRKATTGVTLAVDGMFDGYTLVAPSESKTTYLVDLDGEVVHEWQSEFTPGLQVELLENGRLLRTGKTRRETPFSKGKGWGGVVELLDWRGTPTWRYRYASSDFLQHHDVEALPNGNVLLLAWELVDEDTAIAAGRDP